MEEDRRRFGGLMNCATKDPLCPPLRLLEISHHPVQYSFKRDENLASEHVNQSIAV